MPYEFYKVLHLASIFVFLTGASVLLVSRERNRMLTMATGIASLFILIAGMGLVARLQVGFPPWVIGKLVIWLVVTGLGHLVAKRFPDMAVKAYWLMIVLATVAACLAIYKP